MPDFLQNLANNLREQILAVAPDGVRASLEGLPSIAFLGAAGGIILLLLLILFSLLGAIFGGGKRRKDELEAMPPRHRDEPRREPAPPPRPAATRAPEPRPQPQAPPPPAPVPAGPDHAAAFQEAMRRGDQASAGGDQVGALEHFKIALEAARQMSSARPQDWESARCVAQALHRVGDCYARKQEFNLARQHHDQALDILRRMAAAAPDDLNIAREIAVTLERVGAACAATGDRMGARKAWEEELMIAQRLASATPNDLTWTRFQAVIHVMIGNLNEVDSRARYEQARQMFEVLERAGQLQGPDLQTLNQLRQVLGAA